MAEDKIPLTCLRAMFVGQPTSEDKIKGYYNNIHYDIWIKQEGVGIWVKRGDERNKGESKKFYNNFKEFSREWYTYYNYPDK